MKNQTDPVVQNLTSWINRSAGQHQRRAKEVVYIEDRLMQGGAPQTPDQSELLKQWRANAVATALLNQKREEKPMPVEYAGEEPVNEEAPPDPLTTVLLAIIVVVLLVAAVFVAAPPLFWIVTGQI